MGELRYDCPHRDCRTKGAAFTTLYSVPRDESFWSLFCLCAQCRKGVVLYAVNYAPTHHAPNDLDQVQFAERFKIVGQAPQAPQIEAINNLPPNVRSLYEEAERNYNDNRLASAAMAYRGCMERALKIISPMEKGTLYQRVEKLANSMPAELISLLHEIRFLGNNGAHEIEDPEQADVAAGRDFVKLFFTYHFDLPQRLALAKAKREGQVAG